VLGIVHTLGPLSPYAVLAEFAASPSGYWSASAGAVYPAVQRLVRRGLISSRKHSRGSRTRASCSITPRGERALIEWIGPPWPFRIEATTFDPIRTRVSFLAALRPRARVQFLEDAEGRLVQELGKLRTTIEALRRSGNRWETLATLGSLEELRGRLRWVRALRRHLSRRAGRPSGAR